MLLLVTNLVFISCDETSINSKEAETTGIGTFTYKGVEYSTPNFDAIIYDEFDNDTFTGYDLVFYSEEMKLNKNDIWYYGNGNMVWLSIITPEMNKLTAAEYNWDTLHLYSYADTVEPYTLHYGDIYIHSQNLDEDIIDGKVTILVEGDAYTITYTAKLPDGNDITGDYTGKCNHYNGNYW